jgi:hypothetical protein
MSGPPHSLPGPGLFCHPPPASALFISPKDLNFHVHSETVKNAHMWNSHKFVLVPIYLEVSLSKAISETLQLSLGALSSQL